MSYKLTFLQHIRDQGYGISPDEQAHIWDRFYKVDKSRKGNNIGLDQTISNHLIEYHNSWRCIVFTRAFDAGRGICLIQRG